MPSTGGPRQVQECGQRVQGVRTGGGHEGPRQGLGTHLHWILSTGNVSG